MQYCPMCGASADDRSRNCAHCGANLPGAASAVAPTGYRSSTSGAGYNDWSQPQNTGYGSNDWSQPAQNQNYGYNNNYGGYNNNYGGGYSQAPAHQLRTNRSLGKFFWLSLITFGIYGFVVMCHISSEVNLICFKHDGKKTMHYALVTLIFSWLTLGILPLVWQSNLCGRIGRELRTRNINYSFNAGTFWLWGILGAWIVAGPFIYTHKLMRAMNLLAQDYNVNG